MGSMRVMGLHVPSNFEVKFMGSMRVMGLHVPSNFGLKFMGSMRVSIVLSHMRAILD